MDEFEHLMESKANKPKVIIVTESWIKESEKKFFNMQNYNVTFSCRKNSRGGGICVFVRKDIRFEKVTSIEIQKSHVVIIQLYDPHIRICAIYRSPSTEMKTFMHYFDHFLEKSEKLIICGDFNIDLLKNDENIAIEYNELIKSNGFKLLNTIDSSQFTYSRGNYCSI